MSPSKFQQADNVVQSLCYSEDNYYSSTLIKNYLSPGSNVHVNVKHISTMVQYQYIFYGRCFIIVRAI